MGDTVFKDSEEGHSLYIIKKGEVKACKTAPDGELFTLTILKDGEIFGEMSFLDERPHSAAMIAVSDVETYIIEKSDFDTIVDEHPRIIYKLMKNIVFTIHAIVRGMNSRYIEMINYMWGRKRGT
jgi:CRP-like cAMP-binding protein